MNSSSEELEKLKNIIETEEASRKTVYWLHPSKLDIYNLLLSMAKLYLKDRDRNASE